MTLIEAIADSMSIMCKGRPLSEQTEQHQEEFRRCAAEALRKVDKTIDYESIVVPSDIQEFGERHRIPTFSSATYRNGVVAGFRTALETKEGRG